MRVLLHFPCVHGQLFNRCAKKRKNIETTNFSIRAEQVPLNIVLRYAVSAPFAQAPAGPGQEPPGQDWLGDGSALPLPAFSPLRLTVELWMTEFPREGRPAGSSWAWLYYQKSRRAAVQAVPRSKL